MPGPRTNAAFYAAPVEEFLTASEEEVYAPLASPHGYTLAALKSWGAVQQSAWRLQLPVLRAALDDLVAPPPAAPAPWIHLEFDIPRLGRRVDAVLVTQKCVIPIEFKVGAKKFERLDEEQAWDYGLDLKNFHAPSHAAPIFPILCATEARDSDRRWKPPHADGVRPPFCCHGESLGRAIRLALEAADKKVPATNGTHAGWCNVSSVNHRYGPDRVERSETRSASASEEMLTIIARAASSEFLRQPRTTPSLARLRGDACDPQEPRGATQATAHHRGEHTGSPKRFRGAAPSRRPTSFQSRY